MMNTLRRFWTDDQGTTSVEYAVVLACLLMVIIGTVLSFGGQAGTLWGQTQQNLSEAGLGH